MKEYKTLLKADFKRHKGSLTGVFLLILLAAAALGTVLTVGISSGRYVNGEMGRAGFGALTAWVSNVSDMESLTGSIENLEDVGRVDTQNLIFSDYAVNDQESDSEGQLLPYSREQARYKFFTDDFSSYQEGTPELLPGEVYVSPSMVSMFGLQAGDKISFPIARAGRDLVLTVKGFYEDPFMGSSMIGMKGFLISEDDYTAAQQIIRDSGIDALARSGAMLHIFQKEGSSAAVSELNSLLNENTSLPQYTEFVHSAGSIAGFMLVLQNAFSGLLIAFVIVLLFVVMVVLGHSISSAVEADYVNMGILKTIGFTGSGLRRIQMIQYLCVILAGMLIGGILTLPLSRFVSSATLTTTGIRIPEGMPIGPCLLAFVGIILILAGFIALKSGKIGEVAPMKAIRGEVLNDHGGAGTFAAIRGKQLELSLALRQLAAGKSRYVGACLVALLLVFFASMIGRMDSWLGADGKGMMEAFNPADHDIGVQIFGVNSSEEAEQTILSYTDITDRYLLAMPGVSVNGIDYTANVISDPERFHMIEGRTSRANDEIVLTEFVASDLGVSVGDTVTVQADMGSGVYTVSGIYTCANDMGANVGLSREGYLKIGQDSEELWCHHYFLADPSQKTAVTEALQETYGGDVHVHENTWPGLFGIISAMQALMVFQYGMVIVFILIVTAMTGSKILNAEKRDIGIFKALGFTSGQLRTSFALRFGLAAVPGAVIGTGLAAVLTDPLVSTVMKMAGISNFASAATIGNTLFPAASVILLFMSFAYVASWKIKNVDLAVLITE
ncbi:ABC transporter permease [Clostridium transplantifaecale]|uniref:ABC transporter permease n=1 Tax=Clostridium transplantifaecale TaxID=2479838 RepID=UPI000F640759|nr:FtsX-like permease family protein [Clostridium transplantifaecale]